MESIKAGGAILTSFFTNQMPTCHNLDSANSKVSINSDTLQLRGKALLGHSGLDLSRE